MSPVVKIDFPMAPLSVDDDVHSVRVGDPAMVRDRHNQRHTGTLRAFDASGGFLVLTQGGAQRRFRFDEINLLMLSSLHQWQPALGDDSTNAAAVAHGSLRREFRLTFKDGDQIAGRTLGTRSDATGMYLYPLHDDRRYRCLFVPTDVISDLGKGPRLGELLIEGKQVTPEDLALAIGEQAEDRKRRIGEYLSNRALVTRRELELAIDRQRHTPTNVQLGDLLVADGVITQAELDEALLDQSRRRGRRLGQVLVDMGLVTPREIHLAVAHQLGFPSVELRNFEIDPDALMLIPEDVAIREQVLPLFRVGSRLAVAVDDPLDSRRLDTLRLMTKLFIDPVVASQEELEDTIRQAYALIGVDAEDAGFDIPEYVDVEDDAPLVETESFVVRTAHKIVRDAANLNASDIHLEAVRSGADRFAGLIRFRRDGSLFNYRRIPIELHRSLVSRYKVMADMNVAEHRVPQDGKINFRRFSRLDQELRAVSVPVAGGQENMVLRLLSSGEPMSLEELGFNRRDQEVLREVIDKPHGMVLVCGPTGAGKTTTLHSLLKSLNRATTKIWTIEDPVEISQAGLNQVQTNNKAGLDFPHAMRAFLRADPDVIMVGEMRDEETIGIAIEASLTGHLVLSTMHTNSAAGSVTRLLDMGVDRFNFADSLQAVLAQRLVRRLCPECRAPHALSVDESRDLAIEYLHDGDARAAAADSAGVDAWLAAHGEDGRVTIRRAKGCGACSQTGYAGRLGIYELLVVSETLRERILAGDTTAELRAEAMREGMRSLRQDGIDKVLAGDTDLHEVRRVSVK